MITGTKDNNTQVADFLPFNWAADSNFKADEVISAYFLGKEEGKKEEFEKWKKQFSVNVKLASSIAEELMILVSEKKLLLNSIHLKANGSSSFEALFLVDKESIKSENFIQAFTLSRYLRNKYLTDRFNVSFSFTADTEEIDLDCLAAEGFFMKYEKREAN